MPAPVTITSLPKKQLVAWGFEVYDLAAGMSSERFLSAIGEARLLPPCFANVRYVLEGMAITDAALEHWLNQTLPAMASDFPVIAIDRRLMSFIATKWRPRIGNDFTIVELAVQAAPNAAISSAVAYGHDEFLKIYNDYLSAVDDARSRAERADIEGFIAVSALELLRIMQVYVGLHQLRLDAVASNDAGRPVGTVEDLYGEVSEMSPRKRGTSPVAIGAMAVAGIGALAMFLVIMHGGVRP